MKKRCSSDCDSTQRKPARARCASGPRAVREQPVEGVDGEAHERRFALAPALVARAARRSAPGSSPAPTRGDDQLRQRRRIEQPEIDALAGERMHHVRGVAHQRARAR